MAADPILAKMRKMCKRVLLGVSDRACPYAFIIRGYDGLIVSNPTRTSSTEFGDRFTKHMVGDLCLHFIRFKDKSIYQPFVEWVTGDIVTTDCVVLRLADISSVINKYAPEKIKLATDDSGKRIVKNWKALSGNTKPKVLMEPIYDYQIYNKLADTRACLATIGSVEHREQFPHMDIPVELNQEINGREYSIVIDPKNLSNPGIMENLNPVKLLVVNGVTMPSITKSLIYPDTKVSKFTMYVWAPDPTCLSIITDYEDEDIMVRSYPINLFLVPITGVTTTWRDIE